MSLAFVGACGAPERSPEGTGTGTGETADGIDPDAGGDPTGGGGGSTGATGETGDGSDTGDGGDGDTSDPGDGGGITCEDQVMQCGDGLDNDGDGKIDGDDPECTGVCDNDEGSFETGIPGDNVDCWQDCFFDGNSGEGDDKCRWNLRCDPENPGEGGLCAYTGGPQCEAMPADTPQACIDFCAGLTPNGCDCFGCCKVDTPDGEVTVFLGSGDDCSLQNLDACKSCTFNDDCSNPCDPDDCEVCFGEEELPEHCDDPTCPDGVQSCTTDSDCADGLLCITGCCVEYVPPG